MDLEVVPGIVPSILATLGPQDSVFCEHGIMLYKEPQVRVDRKNTAGGGFLKTMERNTVGGIPYFLTEFVGPGHVAFSRDGVGELRVLELAVNEEIDVADGSLVCAENTLRYDMSYIKGTNRPGRMIGLWMDRLIGPGKLAIHGYGNIISMTLAPREVVLCDFGALFYKSGTVQTRTLNIPFGGGLLGKLESFEALELIGPGKVALQSVDPKQPHY
ncbi:MAG: AIM24 family protein [Candidatus Thermoplasmatota archaeon]|nr:AIM24 family protein [Candidatus Thermoplasmatota archaeon]